VILIHLQGRGSMSRAFIACALYLRKALCLICPFIAHGFDAPSALGILTNLNIKAFTPQEP